MKNSTVEFFFIKHIGVRTDVICDVNKHIRQDILNCLLPQAIVKICTLLIAQKMSLKKYFTTIYEISPFYRTLNLT